MPKSAYLLIHISIVWARYRWQHPITHDTCKGVLVAAQRVTDIGYLFPFSAIIPPME